jgi:CBS domain-containing protein
MIKNRVVSQAKRLGIVSCQADDRLRKIVRRMADDDISALVVTDQEGYLAGIITRSDLISAQMASPDWRVEPVERFMTRQVITVTPDATLHQVMEILLDKHIHRVVVVREEEDGRKIPIAVISDSDLVCEMADAV